MRVVVDASCNAQGEFRYDEFGQQETSSQPPAALSAHAYVGGLGQRNEMAGLGLYYARHRWYASDLGRWLTPDPIGFGGGLNLFEYANSSPVGLTDPSGKFPFESEVWTVYKAAEDFVEDTTEYIVKKVGKTGKLINPKLCPTSPASMSSALGLLKGFPGVIFSAKTMGYGDFPLYPNLLPERFIQELKTARSVGAKAICPDSTDFRKALNKGVLKWVINDRGELLISPAFVKGVEISHAFLAGGRPVRAAGQAEVSVAGKTTFGIYIDNHSGHYQTPEETIKIGKSYFQRWDINFP